MKTLTVSFSMSSAKWDFITKASDSHRIKEMNHYFPRMCWAFTAKLFPPKKGRSFLFNAFDFLSCNCQHVIRHLQTLFPLSVIALAAQLCITAGRWLCFPLPFYKRLMLSFLIFRFHDCFHGLFRTGEVMLGGVSTISGLPW